MNDTLFSVADQIVLVSGGSRGIGKGLAQGFAERGAQVWIASRDAATLEQTAEELSGHDHPVRTCVCDVSDATQVRECVQTVAGEAGRIDTLLNVAGVNIRQPTENFTEAQFDFVSDINLRGAFFMAQEAAKVMLKAGSGSIINIDSLNSFQPMRNVTPYAMSKCAVNGMTRAMALEWGPRGLRVNGLAPGFILTDLTQKLWSLPEMQQWGQTNTPLGRLGRPEDLIGTAIFLASSAAAFMTGQTLYVDGGFTCGRNWPIPEDGGQ